MKPGDLVVVVAKLNESINKAPEGLITGTFLGYIENEGKKVEVLLGNGNIFIGNTYDLIPAAEQE